MNDDAVQDLKQFITTTVSQQVADVNTQLGRVESKIDALSVSVAEAIESVNESTDAQLKNHDQRLTRLEQNSA